MKILSLLALSGILPSPLLACQVTLNDEVFGDLETLEKDVTEEFYVEDAVTGEKYVDCIGKSKCRDMVITDCPVVRCGETEACNSAQIINFTESVVCLGLHACHRTEMIAAPNEGTQTVRCEGSGACDVAHIIGDTIEQVTCSGVKACRKVKVEGSKLVKCHNGSVSAPACEGFATLETNCLYCGKNGCEKHINMCRYKILDENSSKDKKYLKCVPETVVGDCPEEMEKELESELNGVEQIDTEIEGGTR